MSGTDTGGGSGAPMDNLGSKIPIAVADAKGVEVDELDETLYDALDPMAINKAAESENLVSLKFEFNGYLVTVTEEGEIELEQQVD